MEKDRFTEVCHHVVRFTFIVIALIVKIFAFALDSWGYAVIVGDIDDQSATNNQFGLWQRCYCLHETCICRAFKIETLPGWLISVQAMETTGFILLLAAGMLMFIYFFRSEMRIYKLSTIILLIKFPIDVTGITVFCIYLKSRGEAVWVALTSAAICAILLFTMIIKMSKPLSQILLPQRETQLHTLSEPDALTCEQNRQNEQLSGNFEIDSVPDNIESVPAGIDIPIAYGAVATKPVDLTVKYVSEKRW